jgi:hypothetical protein
MDIGSHLKESFRGNKAAYIGGATFLGLILSKLPARRKKVYVEKKGSRAIEEVEKAGIWLVAAQFLFKLAKPAVTSFISRQLTDYLKNRAHGGER